MDKEWAISNGCWDGNIENAAQYNNPSPGHEPLQKIENGTGPYRLKSWEPAKQFVFERFDGYWGARPRIKTGIVKYVKEWSTRKIDAAKTVMRIGWSSTLPMCRKPRPCRV